MKLNLVSLCGNTWEGAEMARKAKATYIQEQLDLGHMMRTEEGKIVVTVAGCNAYQAEWDAEYADVTTSNNARLVNNLVAFKR